ncbi:serine protease 27-like [Scleropages formosus]|uniref:Serine protease 27-like n=1 Tax=Scleropages formosus TaxID=113540 RepID=A0A0P7UTL5_SCLFO|nr:serine protease 27-like [Scleropages formosus]
MPRLTSSIIGGENAKEGDWPWMAHVYVVTSNTHATDCGGSLISERWVLTAACCFKPSFIKEESVVRLGAYWLSEESQHESQYGMRKVILHPKYSDSCKGNDIALVELDRKATLSHFVKPVVLANPSQVFDQHSDCRVTGWGMTGKNVPLKDPGGDTGGPLVCKVQGQWVQAGIVSFSTVTPEKKICAPSFYTRVSSFRDFIKNNTFFSTEY